MDEVPAQSEAPPELPPKPVWRPAEPGKRGAHPEYLRELAAWRKEAGKIDPKYKGGRPRIRFTRAEATEAALARLEPEALKVLEQQLKDPDQRIRQTAAKLLLEWKRGKPTQSIKQTGDQVTTIRYEAAAWQRQDAVELPESDVKELEAGE